VSERLSTSIVLPVHNQEDHVRRVIDDYVATLAPRLGEWELILVPNACTDATADVCRRVQEVHPLVKVVELERGGWGRAVRAGLAAATGDLLCYTNSARTSPEMLALTLHYAHTYPKVVIKANRRLRDSARRRLGSLIYNLECRVLFELSIWDVNGTPKVFPRTFSKLLALTRDDDLIDAEFALVCKDQGYPMVEVPLLETVRHSGRSTTNYSSALKLYVGAYRLARAHRS
jgi:glycosyltransferase involved in cell wall biosynthesis